MQLSAPGVQERTYGIGFSDGIYTSWIIIIIIITVKDNCTLHIVSGLSAVNIVSVVFEDKPQNFKQHLYERWNLGPVEENYIFFTDAILRNHWDVLCEHFFWGKLK